MNCLVAHADASKRYSRLSGRRWDVPSTQTSFTAVHLAVGPTNFVFAQARHGDLGRDKLVSGDIFRNRSQDTNCIWDADEDSQLAYLFWPHSEWFCRFSYQSKTGDSMSLYRGYNDYNKLSIGIWHLMHRSPLISKKCGFGSVSVILVSTIWKIRWQISCTISKCRYRFQLDHFEPGIPDDNPCP